MRSLNRIATIMTNEGRPEPSGLPYLTRTQKRKSKRAGGICIATKAMDM